MRAPEQKWLPDEKTAICQIYPFVSMGHLTSDWLAKKLGRNAKAVRAKAQHLKVNTHEKNSLLWVTRFNEWNASGKSPEEYASDILIELGLWEPPTHTGKPQIQNTGNVTTRTDSELWDHAEALNAKHVAAQPHKHRFYVEFPDDWIALTFMSDQHIAIGQAVDLSRMRNDAELVKETDGMYAILGGDGIDAHIKHRSAIIAARSQPDDQLRLFDHYLKMFGDSILCMISGNHDQWIEQIAGIDAINMLAQKNKIAYSPHFAYVDISVGAVDYLIGVRHQYRYNSSLNMCHTVKRWYDQGERQFDIGVICHHHEPAMETFQKHGQTHYAARPGAYQHATAHSKQYGFNDNDSTCPTYLLSPKARKIIPYMDIEEAANHLTTLRNQ